MITLGARLAQRIMTGGPITVADYMAAALGDAEGGYYRRNDPLGVEGDFTTAPEISQIFGELIGAWLIDCWEKMGRPGAVHLVELGPGRGTLMADALRVGRHISGWRNAVTLHLVEINPRLKQLQADRLGAYRPHWHNSLADVPEGPILLVANEFLDALPIRQMVFWKGAWRERLVGWNEDAGFHFVLSQRPDPLSALIPPDLSRADEGTIYELSPSAIGIVAEIARRVACSGGAGLLIDYGRSKSLTGESLQAVRRHVMVKILDDPGEADLSSHVDFGFLRRVAIEGGVSAFGPVSQGKFLQDLGIEIRASQLKSRTTHPNSGEDIDRAVQRLTDPSAMGALFKVMSIIAHDFTPAGFSCSKDA